MPQNKFLKQAESEKIRKLSNDLRGIRDDISHQETVERLQEIQFELDGIESAVRVRREPVRS